MKGDTYRDPWWYRALWRAVLAFEAAWDRLTGRRP